MTIPQPIQDAYAATADVVAAYASLVAAGAGAVGALVAILVFAKFAKRHEHDEVAANLGVLLFLVVTTEGMWEVVHSKLGVPVLLAVAMFAAYDVVIYGQRATALRELAKDPDARIAVYLAIIWALSIAASVTVSFASGNTATWFFRFFSPLVGAALATQKILSKRGDRERQESNWIWTPTRLMIRWGWMKPGAADDLTETFQQRRVAALVDAGMELYVQQQAARLRGEAPAEPARWWRRRHADPHAVALRRLQQLTKAADATTVASAREQLRRVLHIETELFRDDSQPTADERALMDEIRLSTRMATTGLRGQVDQIRTLDGARVEVGGIRMPAALAARIPDQIPADWIARHRTIPARPQRLALDQTADQIRTTGLDQTRTTPVDQTVGPERTSEVDQTGPRDLVHARTNPAPVDQTPTSGSVPATRTTPAQRTTARVDRAKPVSPASGGEIPPRVRDMVRDLKRAYRGDIPGRRTVMDRMGWTSAGDAQTAINLVRAERTKTTEES